MGNSSENDGLTVVFHLTIVAGIALLLAAFLFPWRQYFAFDDDTATQRSMAAASWLVGALSLTSMIVGIATLIFLRRTLQETSRSASAAEAAANHAAAAVSVARKVGEAQVRAYLAVTSAKVELTNDLLDRVVIRLENAGQSPALKAHISCIARSSLVRTRVPIDPRQPPYVVGVSGKRMLSKKLFDLPARFNDDVVLQTIDLVTEQQVMILQGPNEDGWTLRIDLEGAVAAEDVFEGTIEKPFYHVGYLDADPIWGQTIELHPYDPAMARRHLGDEALDR